MAYYTIGVTSLHRYLEKVDKLLSQGYTVLLTKNDYVFYELRRHVGEIDKIHKVRPGIGYKMDLEKPREKPGPKNNRPLTYEEYRQEKMTQVEHEGGEFDEARCKRAYVTMYGETKNA